MYSEKSGRQKALPSIAALVPRSRISSTLPAFNIPVPSCRMSSTLPSKLSMPGTARRAFRRKDVNRRDHGSRQSGRPKHHAATELVLRVVQIDISGDEGQHPCQQDDVTTTDENKTHSTVEPVNDDDDDSAIQQFQRTARMRQGKYFKKSTRRSVRETATDQPPTANNECPQQVCTLNCTAVRFICNNCCLYL